MKKRMAHLCVYNRNVGDNALNLAIDDMFKSDFDITYFPILSKVFNRKHIKDLNGYDVVLLGGGGLIHSYKPNKSSWKKTGTMWEIPLPLLKQIKSKIILYSVGYNRFYGEPKATSRVSQFFKILLEKGADISFRNDGSLKRFLHHFPQFKAKGITEVPDAGLFFKATGEKHSGDSYVAVNIAADRLQQRYKNQKHGGVQDVVSFINKCNIDYAKVLIPHTPDDSRLYRRLKLGNDWIVRPFTNKAKDTNTVIKLYRDAVYSISTRGHSQLCSIGNNVPTFAISTHPKVVGFMKDNGLLDFCYNYRVSTDNVGLRKFNNFIENYDEYKKKIISLNIEFEKTINNYNRSLIEKLR